jgi:hypothetical protein
MAKKDRGSVTFKVTVETIYFYDVKPSEKG